MVEQAIIAPVCPNANRRSPEGSGRQTRPKPHQAQWVEEDFLSDTEELAIYTLGSTPSPLHAEVVINGTLVGMEVDTGATVSLISQAKQRTLLPELVLQKSKVVLKTYTGECRAKQRQRCSTMGIASP